MSATATSSVDRALELARQLGNCCEDYTPVEVIAALSAVLSSVAAGVAEDGAGVSKALSIVQHRAYDGAMTLIAARQPRH